MRLKRQVVANQGEAFQMLEEAYYAKMEKGGAAVQKLRQKFPGREEGALTLLFKMSPDILS